MDWQTVKCLVIAGPGFVKDDFKKHMDEEAVRQDLRQDWSSRSLYYGHRTWGKGGDRVDSIVHLSLHINIISLGIDAALSTSFCGIASYTASTQAYYLEQIQDCPGPCIISIPAQHQGSPIKSRAGQSNQGKRKVLYRALLCPCDLL